MKHEQLYDSKVSDNLFEKIVTNLQEGMLATDKEDRIIYINPCMERILGLKMKDLMGLSLSTDFPIETIQNTFPYYLKAKSTLEPVKYHVKIVTPAGENAVLEGWCVPHKEDDAYNGMIISTIREITSPLQNNTVLHARDHQWECLYSILPVGISILDKQGKIVEFNIALGRILSVTDKDLQNGLQLQRNYFRTDGTLMPEDEFPSIRAVKEQRTIRDIEIGIKKKNNEIVWAQVSAAPLNLPGISCIVSTTDITKQKKVELALRESEEKYRRLFDNASLGIFQSTPEGKLISFNSAFARMFGFDSPEDAVNNIHDIAHDLYFNPSRRAEFIKLASENPALRTFENWYRRKNGSTFIGSLNLTLIRDSNDQLVGIEGFIEDITKRKHMEENLQKAKKFESLGVVAGGIAHDFNNLLGGIFGYIDLADGESNESETAAYLTKALDTINRARALTAQLLTISKGGAPIQKIYNMNTLIRESAQSALSGSNISCRFDIAENIWLCNVDKDQIEQVISNLINTFKHTMTDGGSIEINAVNIYLREKEHNSLTAGNYLKFSIKDSGTATEKIASSHIFDPFKSTNTKKNELGLGLATCHSIVNRHSGAIDVTTEQDKSFTFHIYLPAFTESVKTNPAPTFSYNAIGTIIVMDDEEVIRDTVSKTLKKLGYSVVCKNNGKEVLSFFIEATRANKIISGIILDLTIPDGMGGKRAIEEIRKLDKDIPVFVSSGYVDDLIMKMPTAYGFTASICKPFRKVELEAMLNTYLRTREKCGEFV